MTRTRRLLALAAYPEGSAATRFRLIQMVPYLRAHGWEVCFEPFVEDEFFADFHAKHRRSRKAAYLASRTLSRIGLALSARDFDAVFIQREASLIGPAYAESILSMKGLPIIFDFDDAIWHYDLPRSSHPLAARILKNPQKCWSTMQRAALVVAGSSYLAARAREQNDRVETVPTVVSSATWTPLPGRHEGAFLNKPPRIGWVGSHSTAHQLELVRPALSRLRAEGHSFDVRVVGAAADFHLEGLEIERAPWRLDVEMREFQQVDIGLAPMHQQAVYQGKCGFKQLQYMAVGVPFVSSWVGGARDFVVHGDNGLVAATSEDWYSHLKALLESQALRAKLSCAGRDLVETHYSIERQGPRLARCIDAALGYDRAS